MLYLNLELLQRHQIKYFYLKRLLRFFSIVKKGVRQGENLSSFFFFSIFLNDLEHYMPIKQIDGVKTDFYLANASFFLKLLIILYADDTVILVRVQKTFRML